MYGNCSRLRNETPPTWRTLQPTDGNWKYEDLTSSWKADRVSKQQWRELMRSQPMRYRVRRTMLVAFWHRQCLVQNIIFNLYFRQNWPTLQRGLSATAELLVRTSFLTWFVLREVCLDALRRYVLTHQCYCTKLRTSAQAHPSRRLVEVISPSSHLSSMQLSSGLVHVWLCGYKWHRSAR